MNDQAVSGKASAKRSRFALRVALPLVASVALAAGGAKAATATNLLSNPGFELDGSGGTQNLPGWQTFGANYYTETGSLAHSGTNYFKVYQAFNGSVNTNGIYQDYISGPGAIYNADGWAYSATGDVLAGKNAAWIEVTFRDANANVLALYRSALITTNTIASGAFPASHWNDLPITNQYNPNTGQVTNTTTRLVAPAGTYFLRYQMVFQGDANYSAGSVYFDDLTLTQPGGAPYGNMNIVWTDEFNGNAVNTNLWTYDLGNGGWGNQELEYYTSRTNNAYVTNGLLHIAACQENYGGASYTSARLKSQGLFSFKYGRLEWRAQLPAGTAFWPALWLLGTNITTSIGWPGCGEIDVMENNGSYPLTVQGSIHSGSDATGYYNFINGLSATNFHTYTLDWNTNAILFYVDGHLYETQTNWSTATGNSYPFPFNQPFFIIMNVAIGGSYLGNPTTNAINAGSAFPSEMRVDYVRLYSVTNPLRLAVQRSGTNMLLSWETNIVCRLQMQTGSLSAGGAWSQVSASNSPVTITPRSGSAFYRLASP
jgi:beta-glucanase (GH16 family)